MATTYTGNAAGGSLASAVQISVPQDGVETLSVSSVNTPMQKTADYLEALRVLQLAPGALTYIVNPGNIASGSYWAWAGTSQAAVAAASGAQQIGQTTHMAGYAGQVRGLIIKTGQLTAGGLVNITIWKNNVASAVTIALTAGTAAGTIVQLVTGIPLAFALGDTLEVVVNNGGAVTASIGLSMVTMVISRT